MIRGGLVAFVALVASTTSASADRGALRLVPYFGLGLGGDLERDDAGVSVGPDLKATPSVGVWLEHAPRSAFPLVTGMLVEASFVRPDDVAGIDFDRSARLAIDGFVGLRYRSSSNDARIDPHVVVPVGLSVLFPNLDTEVLDPSPGLGWNVGVIVGAHYLVGSYGVLFEVGWVRHDTFHRGDPDRVVTNQAVLNVGAVLAF
jgi:hypothetical protein